MRLALLGRDISHSRSPELYRNLLGPKITYDLIDVPTIAELPSVDALAARYDAVNITSPYKEAYVPMVTIEDPAVRSLGAINTIDLRRRRATNTDLLAVRKLLSEFQRDLGPLRVELLGAGTMARVTRLVCEEQGIPHRQHSRSLGSSMENLDLSEGTAHVTLIINACSRKFTFRGRLNAAHVFWDYNYNFTPHQNSLPSQVKTYHDGLSLLRIQAEEAVKFWSANIP